MTDLIEPFTVTRDTLANLLVLEEAAPSQTAARKAIDTMISELRYALRAGCVVNLRGFGTFSVTQTAPRPGRNPKTGEEFEIPAGRKVKFKPSKKLLED